MDETTPHIHGAFDLATVPLVVSGKRYDAPILPDKGSPERFSLLIDGIQSYEWFQKQRNHAIKRITGIDPERQPKIKIDRGQK